MSTAPQGRAPWFVQLHDRLAVAVDRKVGWQRLPKPLGLLTLVGLRDNLRRKNLFDTGSYPSRNLPEVGPPNVQNLTGRTADGTYNDLADPRMGMARSRFGRNVPPDGAFPEPEPRLLSPSPREVSRALLTRHEFVPAESVNALVAAWLQFMVRDWVSHGQGTMDRPWRIDLTDDDPWPTPPMLIPRTIPDPPAPTGTTVCRRPSSTRTRPGGTRPNCTETTWTSNGRCAPAKAAGSGSLTARCSRTTRTRTRREFRASGWDWP